MMPAIGRRMADNIRQKATDNRLERDMNEGMAGESLRYAAGDRGQQAVELADRMRAAARFSELEDEMRTTQITKSLEEEKPGFIGPPSPTSVPSRTYTGGLSSAAMQTVDWEGRKDRQGNLMVYELPAGDMGGSFEVAGINNRYHPEAAETLRNMDPSLRRDFAADYITRYTSPMTSKLPPVYQPFFQDLAFNRGLGGATKFLQRALGVNDDGVIGPKTLAALEKADARDVMRQTSLEQLQYERRLAEQNPARKKFLQGLENRIRNRLAIFGKV